MGKIPIGKTVAYAYSFAFESFLPILGLAWLPLLIVLVSNHLLLQPYQQELSQSSDLSEVSRAFPFLLAFAVIAFVCGAMARVGVMQQALGLRSGQVYYYFSLAPPVWRLLGAYILLVLALMALAFAGTIVLFLLMFIFANASDLLQNVAGVALSAAFAGAMIYALLRLAFLLTPVVVAENRISLRRPWELSRGNFWRMFAVVLAIVVPLALAAILLLLLVVGWAPFEELRPGMPADEMEAWSKRLQAAIQEKQFIVDAGEFVISLLGLGLGCGAMAAAYRALVPIPPVTQAS